jgi:hypothetical protein
MKKKGANTMSEHLDEIRAYAEKLGAQLQEAKSQIQTIEAHHKGKVAQAEIDDLKTKSHEIDKKHRHLKTVGEVAKAAVIKTEIEADLAKLKASLEQFNTKVKSQAATK